MKPLKVSEINHYIKRMFNSDMILSNVQIEGEISNFKRHYSGHLYFVLKDEKSRIRCIMFKNDAEKCNMNIVDGQKVIANGYVSVYEKGGEYQLYVKNLIDKGIGELYKTFEELKNRLESQGIFDLEFKKTIPFIPNKIGVVTSATGAAIRDIITVIRRRYPSCNILIYPSLVQGNNAPKNIIDGLLYLDNREDIDLIIMGRGGGSLEELFAFNDEKLARTIFQLNTPIISAVGHETDFTIADFVSDLRAPTPSAAAEMAVPNIKNLSDELVNRYKRLENFYEQLLKFKIKELKFFSNSLKYNNPIFKIKDKKQELDMIFKDICNTINNRVNDNLNRLNKLEKKLQILNPLASLDRGHSIILDKSGYMIKSIKDISIDDQINIIMKDGILKVTVNEKNLEESIDGYK